MTTTDDKPEWEGDDMDAMLYRAQMNITAYEESYVLRPNAPVKSQKISTKELQQEIQSHLPAHSKVEVWPLVDLHDLYRYPNPLLKDLQNYSSDLGINDPHNCLDLRGPEVTPEEFEESGGYLPLWKHLYMSQPLTISDATALNDVWPLFRRGQIMTAATYEGATLDYSHGHAIFPRQELEKFRSHDDQAAWIAVGLEGIPVMMLLPAHGFAIRVYWDHDGEEVILSCFDHDETKKMLELQTAFNEKWAAYLENTENIDSRKLAELIAEAENEVNLSKQEED